MPVYRWDLARDQHRRAVRHDNFGYKKFGVQYEIKRLAANIIKNMIQDRVHRNKQRGGYLQNMSLEKWIEHDMFNRLK